MLLWNCLGTYELRGKLRGVTFLWLAMLIPFVDETIQLFTEGRSGQISGCLAGYVRCVVWYLSDGWFWVFSDQVEEKWLERTVGQRIGESMKMTEFLVKHFVKNYEKVSDVEVRTAYGILASFVGIRVI